MGGTDNRSTEVPLSICRVFMVMALLVGLVSWAQRWICSASRPARSDTCADVEMHRPHRLRPGGFLAPGPGPKGPSSGGSGSGSRPSRPSPRQVVEDPVHFYTLTVSGLPAARKNRMTLMAVTWEDQPSALGRTGTGPRLAFGWYGGVTLPGSSLVSRRARQTAAACLLRRCRCLAGVVHSGRTYQRFAS